jgi:hypothetical protein
VDHAVLIGVSGLALTVLGLLYKVWSSSVKSHAANSERMATFEARLSKAETEQCTLQDMHSRCTTTQTEKMIAATRLEEKFDALSRQLIAFQEAQEKRMESFQGQILRDLAAVQDTVELRLRRDLDPLIRVATELSKG